MEQTLIAGDVTTKNSALASAKRLAEKKFSAEQLVKEREEEVQSMGLVREIFYRCCIQTDDVVREASRRAKSVQFIALAE